MSNITREMYEGLPKWYYEQALDYIDSIWHGELTNSELHTVTRRQREAEYKLMAEKCAGTRVVAPSDATKEEGIKVQKSDPVKRVVPMIPSLPPGIRDMRCAYYQVNQAGSKKVNQGWFSRRTTSTSNMYPHTQSFPTDILPPAT